MPPLNTPDQRVAPSREAIAAQLDLLVNHRLLRSSKRLTALLNYVVQAALNGSTDSLKERTIGVDVFERDPNYDTSADHIVRTAASELRKRLAVYYGDPANLAEIRIDIPSGAYIPQFTQPDPKQITVQPQTGEVSPASKPEGATENSRMFSRGQRLLAALFVLAAIIFLGLGTWVSTTKESPRTSFWKPLLRQEGPLLFVVGDEVQPPPAPSPTSDLDWSASSGATKLIYPSTTISDAGAMTRIATALASANKQLIIQGDPATSFSDLQNGPAVLIGLFNNHWSLRLTRPLRFSFSVDADRNLLYIYDRLNPGSRSWSVPSTDLFSSADLRANRRPTVDFALISRIQNSQTGKVTVIAGGLYTYGTEAACRFLTDPQLENLTANIPLNHRGRNLQIILRTDVIGGNPGPPKIVAFSED